MRLEVPAAVTRLLTTDVAGEIAATFGDGEGLLSLPDLRSVLWSDDDTGASGSVLVRRP